MMPLEKWRLPLDPARCQNVWGHSPTVGPGAEPRKLCDYKWFSQQFLWIFIGCNLNLDFVGILVFAPFLTGELTAFHRPSSWIKRGSLQMKNVRHILVTSSCHENVVLVWFSLQRQNLASATKHKSSYFFQWIPGNVLNAGPLDISCDKYQKH